MITTKDLFENDRELMDDLIEGLIDIPEDAVVSYEVWALGYTADEDCTDDEILLGEFTDLDEAVKCAEATTLERINELGHGDSDSDTAYFSIEVETVIADPDDEDGGTVNIGTVYQRDIWLDGSEENNIDSVVELKNADFEITEDGNLKVSCKLLKDFNKNDYVGFTFVDDDIPTTLTYKIISKVIYADGDYYHCELMI